MNAREVAAWKEQGELVINGQTMMCPAWCVVDVAPLLSPSVQRGQSLLIPGRPGRLAMPRRRDETTYQLPMVIDSTVSRTGAPYSSLGAGLAANLADLDSLATGPTSSPRTVTLGGRSGAAFVSLALGDQEGTVHRAVLELTFPGGGLI